MEDDGIEPTTSALQRRFDVGDLQVIHDLSKPRDHYVTTAHRRPTGRFPVPGCMGTGQGRVHGLVWRVETEERRRVAVRVRATGVAGREGRKAPSPVDLDGPRRRARQDRIDTGKAPTLGSRWYRHPTCIQLILTFLFFAPRHRSRSCGARGPGLIAPDWVDRIRSEERHR